MPCHHKTKYFYQIIKWVALKYYPHIQIEIIKQLIPTLKNSNIINPQKNTCKNSKLNNKYKNYFYEMKNSNQ